MICSQSQSKYQKKISISVVLVYPFRNRLLCSAEWCFVFIQSSLMYRTMRHVYKLIWEQCCFNSESEQLDNATQRFYVVAMIRRYVIQIGHSRPICSAWHQRGKTTYEGHSENFEHHCLHVREINIFKFFLIDIVIAFVIAGFVIVPGWLNIMFLVSLQSLFADFIIAWVFFTTEKHMI